MIPSVGSNLPVNRRNKVDLPLPLGLNKKIKEIK